MAKEKNVVQFYVLCNKLKNVIRTGWKDWHVERERLESVAEHIYGVQMLAFAMYSEYDYDIDIMKVMMMLAAHELEEIKIGDLTMFQISREEKARLGHEAISELLDGMMSGELLYNLIMEFDERETNEAKFAYFCDKLECDIQAKIYDEEGCVDLNNQEGNISLKNDNVRKLLAAGKSWSDMWMTFGQSRYNYDENFTKVSEYARTNNIT